MGFFVSVPIRGLFNLTRDDVQALVTGDFIVSVPIRGLFNLTSYLNEGIHQFRLNSFRPHQGII